MRLKNIIYQKIKFAGLFLLCIFLTGAVSAQVQKEKKVRQMVDVTLKVVDESDTPLPRVKVVVGEGVIHTETNASGSVSFKAYPEDVVTVSSNAYEKSISTVIDIVKNNTVKLIKSKLYMTSADNVMLPFGTYKKRNITGSTYVISGDRLEKYPSTDIRNGLTGLGGIDVREVNGSPGMNPMEATGDFGFGEKINVSARGRTLMYIVDNVYTDIVEYPLNPSEIESVSVVKDIVGKAMYGPVAADGIVFITTKRGKVNERSLNVNFEQGISTIDRNPEFVSGGVYARLNNLARENSSLAPLYTFDQILGYSKNDPYDKYFPSVSFRDLMTKNTRPITRADVSTSGGNEIVQYFAYVGYAGEGDIYALGSESDYNKVTTRSNLDIQINPNLKIGFDFYGNMQIRRSPNYGYDSDFTSENTSSNPVLGVDEYSDILSDINSIPPIAFPILASYDSISNTPWYGVSSAFTSNPIGNIEGQGYYKDQGRQGSANVKLEYDMSTFVPGLKSTTFLGFNTYNLVRSGKAEDYIAYRATPAVSPLTGNDTINLTFVHNGVSQADMAKLLDYYFQRYAVFENITYEKSFGKNNLLAGATYSFAKTFKNGIEEPERVQYGILNASYNFDDKYSIMGVLNYAGTYSFTEENRYKMFPSIGASWVISDEGFMSGVKFLDYLKLRAEYGTLGVETFFSPYRYNDNWSSNTSGSAFGPYNVGTWFGTSTDGSGYRAYPSRIGNPDLHWEVSKEFSAGFDALLLKGRLSLEATYYNTIRDGSIVQLTNSLPYALGFSGALPYGNYNVTRYYGVESFAQFTDQAGDFRYSFGGSATIQNSERIKYSEPNYRMSYQSRTGKPADAYFGHVYLGKFASDAEALVIPQTYDAVLHKGDLKYVDKNKDLIIDDNDMSMIGHTSPRLFYSVNATVGFKNFQLSVLGTGRAFYDIALTNSYFWNGWGVNNYSKFVQENIGGAYPRLTYDKVNNNFVASEFWLTKGGYFKIQNVELSYNLPSSLFKYIGARGIKVYVRGANLLTFTKVKDVDPESTSAGVSNYPLYKTVSGGLKLNF